MADSDMKCFEEKRKRTKHYLSACINDDVVEPPEDFRTLPVYATSSDILHPGAVFMKPLSLNCLYIGIVVLLMICREVSIFQWIHDH
ncbi:unnamed protein product [Brugia timori]|uniref:Transmembrane protein n=1 Tax=Brugia timori TaxID=42155 RepID=A0A0R3QXE0_9BILA|nr:unnamed protein product [Brugia timori]